MKSAVSLVLFSFALQQTLVLVESSLPLPSYIKPCSRNDPNLSECAKKNGNEAIPYIVKGDRDYKVPQLDPLIVESLRVEEGTNAIKMDLNATDMVIKGLKNTFIEEFNPNMKEGTTKVVLKIPSMALDSKYTIDGAVHGLPIKGKGDLHITLVGYRPTINYRVKQVMRNGEKFIDMHPATFHATVENGTISMSNLFNGDKVLSEEMNLLLNKDWPTLYEELSPAVDEVVKKIMDGIMSNAMEVVPYDQIYPEKV